MPARRRQPERGTQRSPRAAVETSADASAGFDRGIVVRNALGVAANARMQAPPQEAALRRALDDGLAAIGLDLPAAARMDLIRYVALLAKWNVVYNLTAIRTPEAMLVQHVLDSLAVVPVLARQRSLARILDVGTGAGLPGIVLAIVWPETVVHLVEPVGKKAAFLRQCVAELALTHVEIHVVRVEQLDAAHVQAPDLIICRAFASIADYLRAIGHLVGPTTIVAAMKGRHPHEELREMPRGWRLDAEHPIVVPGLQAQRRLLLLSRPDRNPLPD